MSYFLLIFKSAFRNRLRTLLTSVGVAIAIIAFLVLAHDHRAPGTPASRTRRRTACSRATRSRSPSPLPLSYVDKVRNIVGDKGAVSYENWFGAIYPEGRARLLRQPRRRRRGLQDVSRGRDPARPSGRTTRGSAGRHRRHAPGGEVRLEARRQGHAARARSTPATGTSTCAPSTRRRRKAVDKSTMWFHWKYFNEKLAERRKDHVGLILVQGQRRRRSRRAVGQLIDKDVRQLAGRDAHREREGVSARVPLDGRRRC